MNTVEKLINMIGKARVTKISNLILTFIFNLIFTFIVNANPASVYAQVVINEISPLGSADLNFQDWIELYAIEDTDISGWKFEDSTSEIKVIDENTLIGPSHDNFLIFEVGNRLNKDTDEVVLLNKEGLEIDKIIYGGEENVCLPENDSGSIGRYPDANSTIDRFEADTKGRSNNEAKLLPCPSPTPLPTETPKPTQKPRPTSTLKPSPTKIPQNSPTIRLTVTEMDDQDEESILGTEDSNTMIDSQQISFDNDTAKDPESKKAEELVRNSAKKNSPGPVFFILGGLGFAAAGLLPLLKNKEIITKLLKRNEDK